MIPLMFRCSANIEEIVGCHGDVLQQLQDQRIVVYNPQVGVVMDYDLLSKMADGVEDA